MYKEWMTMKSKRKMKKRTTRFNWLVFPWKWEAYVTVKDKTCSKKYLKQMNKK